ncbi:hypothetical protein [Bacteroides sp.]|uniref:hypothetical protein n=1 Tax=Bacteroides sp. TaxID=29523 RepID=UPI003D0FC838
MHLIARGNHLHWSWQFPQLLVALEKKLVIFSKNIKDFLKFLFMFFKMSGGDLKSLGSYAEKSARLSKNVVVAPSKAGGK